MTNTTALVYNLEGRIVASLRSPAQDLDASVKLMKWAGWIEVQPEAPAYIAPDKYWVAEQATNPHLEERPKLALKLAGLELYGVPDKAVITIDGQKYTADGTPIELSFSHPGTFQVQVEAFPYLDASIEVVYET